MEGHRIRPHDAIGDDRRRLLFGIAAAGLAVTIVGWFVAPARTWASVLLAAFYVLGIALAGLLFVAFAYVTKAAWSVALRRVPEALAATLPLGALMIGVALVGLPWLYAWSGDHHDHLLEMKAPWLNRGFFLARAALYLCVWMWFGARIRRVSKDQDEASNEELSGRNVKNSALFLVAFAVTFSLACFDWIMSLEAHWFSTVFAIYNLSGLFLSGLAVITLMALALKRSGALRNVVTDDHLHDLGRLTFGFATFWAYIWFCQYMLIWYGNIPEETAYYVHRAEGAWGILSVLNPVVNWLVPFLVLLPRPAKRSASVMFWIALLLLFGRWLDLYMMILPTFSPDAPAFGLWELAPVAAALPLGCLAAFAAFRRGRPTPVGDPLLARSLKHQT